MKRLLCLVLGMAILGLSGMAQAATGGPDAFGYSWFDSDEPGIDFAWEDISATGTSFGLGDDQVSGFVPIGFDFTFYGLSYNQVRISSNGFITFDNNSSSGCCGGYTIPNADSYQNIIAALWDDLMYGGRYETRGTAPNRRFIVQFNNTPFWSSGGSNTFQYVLYEGSNQIRLNYLNATYRSNRTEIGIEDPSGLIGLKYDVFEGPGGALVNRTVLFTLENCLTTNTATTTFANDNSFAGNMFDVTNVSNVPVVLTGAFEGNFEDTSGTPGAVQVWSRKGSYVGHESDPAGWVLLGTDPAVAPNPPGVPTPFDVGQQLVIEPGETVGLFVYGDYAAFDTLYTDGNNSYVQGALRIDTGVGKGDSPAMPPVSGDTFEPRSWNGTIEYLLQGVNAFNVANATGQEDQAISLAISLSPCLGGFTEVVTVTVNGVPTGASLSAGMNLGGGTWVLQREDLAGLTVTPPASSDADFTLSILIDTVTGGTAATIQKDLLVTVTGVADPPSLNAGNSYALDYYQGPMDISAALADLDGSETLYVDISGLPAGTSFNQGTPLGSTAPPAGGGAPALPGGNTWRFTPAELNGLKISLPYSEYYKVVHQLTVTAYAEEDDGDIAQTTRTMKIIDLSGVLNDDDEDEPEAATPAGGGGCTLGSASDPSLLLLLFGAAGLYLVRRRSAR